MGERNGILRLWSVSNALTLLGSSCGTACEWNMVPPDMTYSLLSAEVNEDGEHKSSRVFVRLTGSLDSSRRLRCALGVSSTLR